MLIKEYRITMPLSVDEYQIGQLYAINEASKRETGGGEGVEILKNEPFEGKTDLCNGRYTKGQYTYKKYYVSNRMPSIFKMIIPAGMQEGHEESWNAYPYCRTVITNPTMGERFFVKFETLHCADRGEQENVHGLPPELLAQREVIHLDIACPVPKKDYKEREDPKKFKSNKTGRGPLVEDDWRKTVEPVMTCYKLVTCQVNFFAVQGMLEKFIQSYERNLFLRFHREMFCTLDDWHGKTMEEKRKLEDETRLRLDEQRRRSIAGIPPAPEEIEEEKEEEK